MTEWQPIKTAPKDGRSVLVWDPSMEDGNRSHIFNTPAHDDRRYAIGYFRGHGERPTEWGNRNNDACYPTHWQPLPEPPK